MNATQYLAQLNDGIAKLSSRFFKRYRLLSAQQEKLNVADDAVLSRLLADLQHCLKRAGQLKGAMTQGILREDDDVNEQVFHLPENDN